MKRVAQTKLVTKSAALPLHDDGSLRLAVVADTHSQPHPATIGHLATLRPDAILHAGDIGDLGVLDGLAAVAPVLAVRGNIDTHARDLPDVLVLDLGAGALRILMLHIGVYVPKLRGEVARLARAQDTSLVICGHSHVPFIGRDAGLNVFNPGSAGPRRFHLPIVFGMLEVSTAGVRLRHIDCESGETWLPPA